MNIIDYVVIGLIALYALNGLYRGFLPSVLNLGGFFVSWVTAFLTYPILSHQIVSSNVLSQLKFYIEGSERINNFELVKLDVSTITPTQLDSIMSNAKLPFPFNNAVVDNIHNLAFKAQGVTTLGDYFNLTIYYVIINIISLLIIFVAVRIILTLITNAVSYAAVLPQLRHFDYLFGAGLGFLRGYFSMHLIFCVVPIIIVLAGTVPAITDPINASPMTGVFYSASLVLRFISGAG